MGPTTQPIDLQLYHIQFPVFGDFIPHDYLLLHRISDYLTENRSIGFADLIDFRFFYFQALTIFPQNLRHLLLKSVVILLVLL